MWMWSPVSARSPVSTRLSEFARSPISARSPVSTNFRMSARPPVPASSPMSTRAPVFMRSRLSAMLTASARLYVRPLEAALTLLLLFTVSVASFECSGGRCKKQGKCSNTSDGAVKCLCDSEYKGYGNACLDINDCAINSTLCGSNEGYVCDCDIGFTKSPDGRSCIGVYPVDEVQHKVGTHHITLRWPHAGNHVRLYTLTWCTNEKLHSNYEYLTLEQHATLDNLKPGQGYPIVVSADFLGNVTLELFSIELRTRPDIQSEMTMLVRSGTGNDDDTILIYYTPTPNSVSEFDEYRFRLEGATSEIRTQSQPATASVQNLEFTGLVPGRLYNITMWTVSHNVTSQPVRRQEVTPPRPITQLNFTDIGPDEVTLTWDEPVGDYKRFKVYHDYSDEEFGIAITCTLSHTEKSLRPYTNYTFVVVVTSGDDELQKLSPEYSKTVTTMETLPPTPQQFRVLEEQPSALKFGWQLDPADVRGVLHRFLLEYTPLNNHAVKTTLHFPHDARTGAVTGLPKGEYLFSLRAETGAGVGAAAPLLWRIESDAPPPNYTVSETPQTRRTDLEAPQPKLTVSEKPLPKHTVLEAPPPKNIYWEPPSELRHTSTTVTVKFHCKQDSLAAGTKPTYTLVLAEQPRNDTPAHLPSWHDVHALDAWPPYQVMEPYHPSNSVAEFTIGAKQCDTDGPGYCNGPLKPNTKYYVKLRIIVAPDNFTDTPYIVVHTDALGINYVTIITSSIFAMALVVLAIIAVRNRCWIKYKEPTIPQLPTSEVPKPFYLNLLFRKQCAKEIAEIEQKEYDEVYDQCEQKYEHIYEEIG